MKKICSVPMMIFCFLFLLLCTVIYSLEVDVNEIKTGPVKFINYQGKYENPDSIRDIEGIGKRLATGDAGSEAVRFYVKYSVKRVTSKDEPEKFSADIFSVDKDAKVGHISMLRKIIASYLLNKYGYTNKEAETLSLFLTYYNAVYRGKTDYYSSKYKSAVMKHVSKTKAGISTKYWEWPGATQMLIPLTEDTGKGIRGSIEPDIISDKKIIAEIRRDEKNIPERKEMVKIKERKLDKDKDAIAQEKEKIREEKKKIEEAKKPVEKKKEELAQKEKELKKEKDEIKAIPEEEKRVEKEKEVTEKEKEIESEKESLKKKEEELAKKESVISEKEKKAEEKETKLTEREEAIQQEKKDVERDEIKRDIAKEPEKAREKLEEKEKELDKREDALRTKTVDENIYANKLYYLKIKEYLEGGHYNNEMYMIDATNMKVLFKSPVENICGSRYDIFSDGVVVITHRGTHAQGHRLTILDRGTLEARTNGTDNIFWRSFIEIRDGFIYAIANDRGKYYLGKFDSNVRLVAKSTDEVNEDTFISFWDNYIYINRLDKTIIVLNKEDLSLIGEVKP